MIVADTNVLVYLLLVTNQTAAAEAVFRQDPDWCAPRLWQSEFLNVLVLYRRRGLLARDQARRAVREASGVLGERVHAIDPDEVLDLASASDCSAYDCEFVALARQLGVPLITADCRVLRAFPQVATSPTDFVGYP